MIDLKYEWNSVAGRVEGFKEGVIRKDAMQIFAKLFFII